MVFYFCLLSESLLEQHVQSLLVTKLLDFSYFLKKLISHEHLFLQLIVVIVFSNAFCLKKHQNLFFFKSYF